MLRIVTALAGLALCVSCTHYHYVERSPHGGTIALEGDRERARAEADEAMRDHCRGDYRIIEEGTAVRQAHEFHDPMDQNAPQQSHVQLTAGDTHRDDYALEYQMTYICDARTAVD